MKNLSEENCSHTTQGWGACMIAHRKEDFSPNIAHSLTRIGETFKQFGGNTDVSLKKAKHINNYRR